MLVFYLAALAVLFVSAFWSIDSFTGKLTHVWTWTNFHTIIHDSTYRQIAFRTIWMAAAVTVTDAVIAFPFAYYMARIASPRMRTILFVLVLLPLWSSYLARIYAWRLILNQDGALNWSLAKIGLPVQSWAFTNTAMWIVFSYIWLPFMILPVYAALERIPDSYLEASRDLGARSWTTLRRVILPLALPGVVAGSIFTFSLTLGDYITPSLVGNVDFIGNVIYRNVLGLTNNLPFAAAYATVPAVVEARATRLSLGLWALLVVLFLWIPLVLICVYAFNSSNIQSWPIAGFSTKWFDAAWHNTEARDALVLSLKAGGLATGVALVLGTAAAAAVSRFRFFGRDAITFLLVLPIALPGVVTGIALNSFFGQNPVHHLTPSLWTIVIGHSTFCIVVVYNNVVARLRRTQTSLTEASMDLGADGWQTFRFITFPVISTALIAGALLAFALSFDEVIVTTFTAGAQNTLPIWILGNLRLGQQLPQVNVVVFFVIVMTVLPVTIAQRLTRDTGILRRR
ncbi:MAG: ABC transporter permease subunit [Actinobacteria bacterium]|nr:MAG: ABC transporter permease subunit [Actinomycetota bacterium]